MRCYEINTPVARAFVETVLPCNYNPQKAASHEAKAIRGKWTVRMRACLVHAGLCAADKTPHAWLYVHETQHRSEEKTSDAASTEHRKKMISLHLTGVSCNADDNKTTKLQR